MTRIDNLTDVSVRLEHDVKLANGATLAAGTLGTTRVATLFDGDLLVRFPIRRVEGAFSESVTLRIPVDSLADCLIVPVGGHSNRDWCAEHETYALHGRTLGLCDATPSNVIAAAREVWRAREGIAR